MLPQWIYNLNSIQIGNDTNIGRMVILNSITKYNVTSYTGLITIVNRVYIGSRCQIHSTQPLKIGDE